MNCTALIAAHNESERIAATLAALHGLPVIDRILVVDDASRDATAQLAASAGAEVIRLPRRCGKGGALNAGLARLFAFPIRGASAARCPTATADPDVASAARCPTATADPDGINNSAAGAADAAPVPESSASQIVVPGADDIILLLDADLGDTASAAARLIASIASGAADMVIGQLPSKPGTGGLGLVLGLAQRGIAELTGGWQAQAPLSGQRALRASALRQLSPLAPGFGVEVALTIRALNADLRVIELPVSMEHRYTHRNLAGFIHRARQYRDIRRTLAALRKTANRL